MNTRSTGVYWGYIVSSLALLIFSYTQVDLNLTLSQAGIVQDMQKAFQYVGFYQRPVSTGIYLSILMGLFISYSMLLGAVKAGKVAVRDVWRIILTISVFLVASYPAAFSYDFFNYLFTAKTVLVYGQNPYTVTPIQFSAIDPWTNFMRWTHLPSAYTPLWIGLSLIPYVLGFGFFLPVLFATKMLVAGFYMLACWALWRTTKSLYALSVFALNPLILLESLVSAHNDIVMIACFLLALYYGRNWLLLSVSVALKFMTITLIPVFALKKNSVWMLGAMGAGLVLVLFRREFLPWYWVWIVPFVALNFNKTHLVRASTIISFGLLASYAPYLYFGEYSAVSQLWKTAGIWSGVVLGVFSLFLPRLKRRS